MESLPIELGVGIVWKEPLETLMKGSWHPNGSVKWEQYIQEATINSIFYNFY